MKDSDKLLNNWKEIIGDLKKGDYDANIMELWKTVDMTEYNVETHSVLLPLVCYG